MYTNKIVHLYKRKQKQGNTIMLVKKIVAASLMTAALSATAADDVSAQLEELKNAYIKQQQEMQAMRQQIKDVESVHNEAIHKYIKDEIKSEVSKQSSLLSLSSHVEGLKIKGDLRLRYQTEDKGDEKRDRFRERVRIGAEWKTSDGWDIGIGVATGSEEGNSTNHTYNDGGETWDTGDLRLDYAYAKHSWDLSDGKQTLILGKMKNPFFTTKAFFDGDYRPTGVAYQVDMGMLFATVGGFTVATHDGQKESDTSLYAAQVGVKSDMFKVAGAVYSYQNIDGADRGGDWDGVDEDGNVLDEVMLFDLLAEMYIKLDGVKITPYAQYSINTEADDEDTAYMVGSKLGLGAFSFSAEWRSMEENAVPSIIMDSDFKGGAGREGIVLGAKYKITKNMTAGVKYYDTEEINGDVSEELIQADLVYKF